MLDDYASVRAWLEELNRKMARITSRHQPTGLNMVFPPILLPPIRLSDTEVIKAALGLAASKIADNEKAPS